MNIDDRPLTDKAYDVVVEKVRAKATGRELASALAEVAMLHYEARNVLTRRYWSDSKKAALRHYAAGTKPKVHHSTRDALERSRLVTPDGHLTPKGWAALEYIEREKL
ncbi:hypothetical protein OS127_02970 [Corynebacterium sp. P6129]|uniref:hypothetical protein n=1 Tax=Corynebacterium antarcticum TaxID=2800405 RepID=UPI002260D712|nr:hypothetical protein [Corynebacterium antarcticum]MCX7491490.1 hypothetical protein [Corynebacterium antarcticum]